MPSSARESRSSPSSTVEYNLQGVNQIPVNHQVGMTFEKGLRAILRHDPDVVMIGEIRDLETARAATQAAMTGHLVLSTLHTNDAASAAMRLIEMGVEPFLVSSTMIGAMAQRLVRRVCPKCRDLQTRPGHPAARPDSGTRHDAGPRHRLSELPRHRLSRPRPDSTN